MAYSTDFGIARPGQQNQSGSTNALFKDIFENEVLSTYFLECIMDSMVRSRTITNGKSAIFPLTGTVVASYHVPGTEIIGQATNQSQRQINVDDLLQAAISIYDLDEAKNYYDFRSVYTTEVGRALAKKKDKKLLQIAILASRATAVLTGETLGAKIVDANMKTNASNLKLALKKAAQTFDEKNVPAEDRYSALPPALHYLLLEDDEVVNSRYDVGGSLKAGTPGPELYGIGLKKTNNMPTGVVAAESGENNTYNGDFTNTAGVVWQKDAIGSVSLLGLSTEMDRIVSRQIWLIVSKFAVGNGILRPSNAIELATA